MEDKNLEKILKEGYTKAQAPADLEAGVFRMVNVLNVFFALTELYFVVPFIVAKELLSSLGGGEK